LAETIDAEMLFLSTFLPGDRFLVLDWRLTLLLFLPGISFYKPKRYGNSGVDKSLSAKHVSENFLTYING
jgi:hypothetical protein